MLKLTLPQEVVFVGRFILFLTFWNRYWTWSLSCTSAEFNPNQVFAAKMDFPLKIRPRLVSKNKRDFSKSWLESREIWWALGILKSFFKIELKCAQLVQFVWENYCQLVKVFNKRVQKLLCFHWSSKYIPSTTNMKYTLCHMSMTNID